VLHQSATIHDSNSVDDDSAMRTLTVTQVNGHSAHALVVGGVEPTLRRAWNRPVVGVLVGGILTVTVGISFAA
jgi:hypothetical protein